MDSRPDANRWAILGATCVAVAISATAWWFGSGLQPLWWMTWIAPVPLLWLATRSTLRAWMPATLIAFAIGGCNLWAYLHDRLHLPAIVIFQLVALPGVVAA